MDEALGWFGDLFRAILLLCPRMFIVRVTHRGVRFRHGWDVSKIDPGIHAYWPLVTNIEVVPVEYRTLDLDQQYLETGDGVTVGLSTVVGYEISDVVLAMTKCWDYEDAIRDKTLAVVKEVVTTKPFEFFKGRASNKLLKRRLSAELGKFGLNIVSVQLSDFARTDTLALWGVSGVISNAQ